MLLETALKYRLIRERFDGKIIVSGNGRRSLILLESESDYEKIQILFLYIVSVDYDTYRDQESIHTCTGG